MRKSKLCEKIIRENYAAVFRFCNVRLSGDADGAEECAQEVFLLLLQKKDELDLKGPIDRWLIAAASRITKQYLREKAKQTAMETDGVENLIDKTSEPTERAPVLDMLTDAEYEFLLRYYSADRESHEALAAELGISVNTLYQRVHALKKQDKTHN
ncbi:MAG: sigma-70 family RNA polymerase sigma factor [Oscillospiraceae bacterium]|nr:sigma-70 family RNA polymerase sigma factor [Oscillospiraceae bacterium]